MNGPHVIWIVTGEAGEYSGHSMWVVCWRQTEEEARAVVAALEAEAKLYRETVSELARRLRPYRNVRTHEERDQRDVDYEQFVASRESLRTATLDPKLDDDASYSCEAIADDARAFALELAARAAEPVVLDDGTVPA